MIEVFKISQGKSIIRLQDLFTLDKNKGARGHTLKLDEVHSRLLEVFFSLTEWFRWNMLDQQIVGATSLNAFKNGLDKLRKTKMGFFMDWSTNP